MMVSIDLVLKICAGFTCICVAAGWLIKIVRAAKKPSNDVKAILKNDDERLKALEESIAELLKVQPMILRSEYVILQHMRTNNSTGEIAKQEEAINEYLFNR